MWHGYDSNSNICHWSLIENSNQFLKIIRMCFAWIKKTTLSTRTFNLSWFKKSFKFYDPSEWWPNLGQYVSVFGATTLVLIDLSSLFQESCLMSLDSVENWLLSLQYQFIKHLNYPGNEWVHQDMQEYIALTIEAMGYSLIESLRIQVKSY